MECFVCKKGVIPEKGYFKTQLWNGKLICHVQCQPKFYFDNKPFETDKNQGELFGEENGKAPGS
jgi:hypothetical protein